jgi:hypothetical protein
MGYFFRTKSVNRGAMVVVALTICFLAGCYERVARGNASVYQFAWWLGPMVIAIGLLGIPMGWLLRKWSRKWGFVLMGMAPLLLLIVAPAMYSDRVLIDDEHFEARYGFWFNPSVQHLRFDGLREIRYVEVPDNQGKTNYELQCVSKTGQVSVVPAGDLVNNAVPEILARAKESGVRVVDDVPPP